MNVEETFKNVVGREMTPDEVTRYLKFQKEFRIPDTDPTWMIFIWFEFYQRIFEKFPEKARAETEKVITQLRSASVAVTEATAADVKASREKAGLEITKMQERAKANIAAALSGMLESEIKNAVSRLRGHSNKPLHRNWLIAMGVLVPLVFGSGGWGLWTFWQSAKNTGEAVVYSEITANGDFITFMKCDNPGWKTKWVMVGEEKHLVCYPYSDKDGNIHGWIIQ